MTVILFLASWQAPVWSDQPRQMTARVESNVPLSTMSGVPLSTRVGSKGWTIVHNFEKQQMRTESGREKESQDQEGSNRIPFLKASPS